MKTAFRHFFLSLVLCIARFAKPVIGESRKEFQYDTSVFLGASRLLQLHDMAGPSRQTWPKKPTDLYDRGWIGINTESQQGRRMTQISIDFRDASTCSNWFVRCPIWLTKKGRLQGGASALWHKVLRSVLFGLVSRLCRGYLRTQHYPLHRRHRLRTRLRQKFCLRRKKKDTLRNKKAETRNKKYESKEETRSQN